ncbi:MAG: 3-mercaptopyruvate sulfurtransferase [Alphaproteobacteria bacterium ADurb.BinA280]|jgi:thiosulfate/3-mercaptopyruvate sulfurtransferase|uniref:sulfurtransferase n=1 Tax=Casimicrobium huifangae TaxID=2591109 RepID=UPI0009C8C8A2|nr:sulfurtransferase [Casimicrobium huifangae]OPZ10266.1 MAG: 3-mercaptopyruvate sulfurtransferase [Alphaproteobacteria bacterium ADurb.BinA280]HOB01903.1 sulfurtransferase [Casimicrobium huifangae]HQA32467.1 sulfurtransferase [Casimicrobium huifangae]HQD64989.1 sulfurtransferase [Casimicrobium huifangae]
MTSPLISTTDLAAQLADPHLVIVDSRHDLLNPSLGPEAYAAGHLPGAIFMSIDDDLSAAKTGSNGRHPWPTAETFAATLGRKGIGNASRVVVYDGGNAMYAGRLWWMLRWLGHDNVFVLDGGYAQWQKEGRAIDTTARQRAATNFQATVRKGMLLNAADTLAALTDPSQRILDARAHERYRGDVEPVDPVAGHIPGALNRPFALNLRDGVFKSAEELRREFEVVLAGRTPAQLIHQCGSGVSACANIIAMEHAGLGGSRLYAGSWSEWCADPSRPVARS